MLKRKTLLLVVSLLALIVFTGACIASPTPVPPAPTQPAAAVTTEQKPENTAVAAAVVESTETAEPTQSIAETGQKGFVLFDKEKGEFHGYAFDGSLLFTYPAPGSDYPSGFTTSILNGAVYYLLPRNRAQNQEPQLLRASSSGVEKIMAVPSENLAALAVSPDETWIAWSTLGPENGVSEMWITNLKTSEQRKIATYSYQQDEAFFLRPFDWTADGKLLFERSLTGIGGYILFGGHNSLYTYDPSNGTIETLVPAEENHGLCLDSYHPKQEKVIFHCGSESNEIVIRDLKDQSQKNIPTLPEQGVTGSASYSPSGKWLAYAIAANNPDNESGQLIVVPSDLSATPQVITQVKDNMYLVVQGWLDDDTLVFNQNQWPQSSTWTVKRDGSDQKHIASGIWIGWLP